MAIKLLKREWYPCCDSYIKEWILDSEADVANLPKCCPGSTAIVATKGGNVYMVNASGEWEVL